MAEAVVGKETIAPGRARAARGPLAKRPRRPAGGLPGTGLVLEAFLPYRLAVVAHKVSRALSVVYAERFGLSIPEWRVMANLGRCGPLIAGELAERSSMDKPKVTRALQRLEAAGMVRRKAGNADRRTVHVALTAKGCRLFELMAGLALDWEREFLAPLSATDRRDLERLIGLLDRRASDMGGNGRQRR